MGPGVSGRRVPCSGSPRRARARRPRRRQRRPVQGKDRRKRRRGACLLKVTGVTAHYRQGAVARATRSDFEALAGRKRKSSEKLGRREPLSTGTLQLGDKEGAFSAGNEHAAWVYAQHF